MANTFQSNIISEAELGSKEGATGSPATFIINNRNGRQSFISGAYPKINFLNHIEALINPYASEQSLLHNMKERLCLRVERYKHNSIVLERVQQRIMNRFGFRCSL